ncbi:hypothetical protein A8A01_06155 [Ewingella americana]|nr:hypothetical protein A8A01_06155 [Ewingella americana]
MGTKTYRIDERLSEEAKERATDFIAKKRELITEAQMIEAATEKGLKEITDEEILEIISRGKN